MAARCPSDARRSHARGRSLLLAERMISSERSDHDLVKRRAPPTPRIPQASNGEPAISRSILRGEARSKPAAESQRMTFMPQFSHGDVRLTRHSSQSVPGTFRISQGRHASAGFCCPFPAVPDFFRVCPDWRELRWFRATVSPQSSTAWPKRLCESLLAIQAFSCNGCRRVVRAISEIL